MTYEVRPVANRDELLGAAGAITTYFGRQPDEQWAERWLRNFELERMHGAFDDGRAVGGAGAFGFRMTVPGAVLPTAGVTIVGVLPTHRRRGILTAMMRAQLDEFRERGETLAALWASEAPIYGRYGYGLASLHLDLKLPHERDAFRDRHEPHGSVRLVGEAEALELIPQVYDRVQAATPGMYERPRSWWEHRRLFDPPERREGGGPQLRAVLDVDGRPEAYALYHHHPSWEGFSHSSRLRVVEAMGATPAATAAMWRYLFDVDWIATVEASLLPVDHPLLLLLAEPRRARFHVLDALWLRLVDAAGALSGRGYAADGRVVFALRDSFCPWNEGTWVLEGGEARRTDAEPDLALDAADLAGPFLGGFTFAELRRAGRVEELREGAVAAADALFRPDVAPWCPEIF